MNATGETLAAIYKVANVFIYADGDMSREEVEPLFEFFQTFPSVDDKMLDLIIEAADKMEDERAIELISKLDADGKQQMSDLFASIICKDGVLTDDEKKLFFNVQDVCGLPDPSFVKKEEEPARPEPEQDDDDQIIPAFIVANFYGIASVRQSEHEDWATLGGELSDWIGANGVEIVRFTPALNKLSEKLRLNERHLVFMVDRNPGNKTVGDNMTATILYGRGYPLYGNIVFALETDKGYEIEGFCTKSLLNETFAAINEAVDGLLRVQE
ncbi:MAG: hypothetical protein J6X77_03995 [Bacteroidales bacterium]|nr:hypothetical protein [Bacteroidales bacterium]